MRLSTTSMERGARLTVKYQLTKTEGFKGLGAERDVFSASHSCVRLSN